MLASERTSPNTLCSITQKFNYRCAIHLFLLLTLSNSRRDWKQLGAPQVIDVSLVQKFYIQYTSFTGDCIKLLVIMLSRFPLLPLLRFCYSIKEELLQTVMDQSGITLHGYNNIILLIVCNYGIGKLFSFFSVFSFNWGLDK